MKQNGGKNMFLTVATLQENKESPGQFFTEKQQLRILPGLKHSAKEATDY